MAIRRLPKCILLISQEKYGNQMKTRGSIQIILFLMAELVSKAQYIN
jgi:hypothetical protein